MPVPKGKVSRSRRDKRSANKNLSCTGAGRCQTCQAPNASHSVCHVCGYYKGVKVMRTKTERMNERAQTRQAARMGAAQSNQAPVDAQ